jgi:hypothetical protein
MKNMLYPVWRMRRKTWKGKWRLESMEAGYRFYPFYNLSVIAEGLEPIKTKASYANVNLFQ